MKKIRKFDFDTQGVMLLVPDQPKGDNQFKKIRVDGIDYKATNQMKNEKSQISDIREVIDLSLYDEDDSSVKLTSFNPQIELRVYFKDSDLPNGNHERIKLAYWDNNRNRWVKFDETNHQFKIVKFKPGLYLNGWSGYCFALIDNWIDPPIAIGR